jgi:hypothetical protein
LTTAAPRVGAGVGGDSTVGMVMPEMTDAPDPVALLVPDPEYAVSDAVDALEIVEDGAGPFLGYARWYSWGGKWGRM